MPRSEKELIARDAKRDIGKELLQAIRDVKAGRRGAEYEVNTLDVAATRARTGLSQAEFAAALRISARTLQHWEQGRRHPSGAAVTLLKIIARHPKVLREVATSD
jgi:putative transcriptional regulator